MEEIEIFTIPVTEKIDLIEGNLHWSAKTYNDNNRIAILYMDNIHDLVKAELSAGQRSSVHLEIKNILRDGNKIELALIMLVSDKELDLGHDLAPALISKVTKFINSLNIITTGINDKARYDKVSLVSKQSEAVVSDAEKNQLNVNNSPIDNNIEKRVKNVIKKAKGAPEVTCYINGEKKTINKIPSHTYTQEGQEDKEAVVVVSGVIDDKKICRLTVQNVAETTRSTVLELHFKSKEERSTHRADLLEAQLAHKTLKITYKPNISVVNGIAEEKGGTLVKLEEYLSTQHDFGFNEATTGE